MSQIPSMEKNSITSENHASAKTPDVDSFAPDEASTRILKEIRKEGLSTEWLEEYFDVCFPIVCGRCTNCRKDDSACRVVHVHLPDADSDTLPHVDILCDDCFTCVRDAFTAIVADDFDSLAQALQRFNVQGEMSKLWLVN